MFISARTERIAVTRSTTQPISASAAASARPSGLGTEPTAKQDAVLSPLWGRDREGGTAAGAEFAAYPLPALPRREEGEEKATVRKKKLQPSPPTVFR